MVVLPKAKEEEEEKGQGGWWCFRTHRKRLMEPSSNFTSKVRFPLPSPPLPSSIFFFLFFRCNRILKSSVVFRLFLLIDRIAGVDVEIGEGIVGANFGGDFMRFCLK